LTAKTAQSSSTRVGAQINIIQSPAHSTGHIQNRLHFGHNGCELTTFCWWFMCVFGSSISGLQRFFNMWCNDTAEHKIVFNCNKAVGVAFYLRSSNCLPHLLFPWTTQVWSLSTKLNTLVCCHT